MAFHRRVYVAMAACVLMANTAHAAFHLMQIEQIIGGVNGDVTAQAVQLRLRSGSQNFVSSARLTVVDATGSNPLLLKDMTTNVTNGAGGARVLLTTSNFANYTSTPLVTDFTMNPIPSSYLAAGQLRFTDDGGTIYWSVSWGGGAFTGSTDGDFTNDVDGHFGPPVAAALPSTTLKALKFDGAAAALSSNNLANYVLSADGGPFTNNAGTQFTVVAPTLAPGDFDKDTHVDGQDFLVWQKGGSPNPLSAADLTTWKQHFGDIPETAALGNVPEPLSITLLINGMALSALAVRQRRRRR